MDASRKSITNPDVFDPRNQLNADGTLKPFAASHTAFGWGRRMCAGQPFAERGLYIMISHMLWAFDCCSRGDGSSLHNISEISSGQ